MHVSKWPPGNEQLEAFQQFRVPYLQKSMVFPTVEPFGLSVSMLPADVQSKLLAYTGLDSSKGAGYIGKSAELLLEAVELI